MRILLVFLFIFSYSLNHAQSHWPSMMEDEQVDFYQVQEAFEQYWETREVSKGTGFKQFKRWEYFMEPRVYPSGERFAADAAEKALKRYKQQSTQTKSLQGDWTYVGNDDVPNNGGGAGRINVIREDPNDANTLYACAPAGGLWKSTDQGDTWSTLTEELEHIGTTDVRVDPNNSQVIYLATGDGDGGDTYSLGVLKSIDGGQTWGSTGLNWSYAQARRINRMVMHPIDGNILWAATSNGVFKTMDGGEHWSQSQAGNYKDIELHPSNPSIVYAAGSSVYRSTDGGEQFSLVSSGLPSTSVTRYALGVSPDAPDQLYALGGGSSGFVGMYRSTDAGQSFSLRSSSPNLLGHTSSGTDVGGQVWYDLAIAVDPTDANVVFTGGVNVWKSTNGGQNWALSGHWFGGGGAAYVHADIHGLEFIANQLYVACDGGVFSSSNAGTSYTDKSDGLEIAQMYRLGTSETQANLVISGWQDNGTNLKNGAFWNRPIGGDGMECIIDPTSASIMYGELYYGSIRKSSNGGATFSTIVSSSGTGVHAGGSWVTPYMLDPADHNTIYVAKDNIYKSSDGGDTWVTLSTPSSSNADALAIAPSDSDYIYYSTNNELYGSTDGGVSFTSLNTGLPNQFITYIAVSNTNPEEIWISYSGFAAQDKIYASADGGTSWINYSEGLPNVPVNTIIHEHDSFDGLYIGTDIGVFYRNGYFDTWQPFFSGMPNVVVSELEINYLTNTIFAATFGRGLWQSDLFSIHALDAGISEVLSPNESFCGYDLTPVIRIQNFGETLLTSATIHYRLDDEPESTVNWTGALSTGASAVVELPMQTMSDGTHHFEAYTTAPNGGQDDYLANDLEVQAFKVSSEELTFQLIADAYASETTWEIIDETGLRVANGGPYTSIQTPGEYPQSEVELCLSTGCFDFYIYDSYGDGICCGYGNGSWQLLDGDENILISDNSDWTTQFTAQFCIEGAADCLGDLDGNGLINVSDFTIFNSAFGSPCESCPADLNGDNQVNVSDFVIFNSLYGTLCGAGVQDGGSEEIQLSEQLMHDVALNHGLKINSDLAKFMTAMKDEPNLMVYPNPNNGASWNYILSSASKGENFTLEVYDVAGQLIHQELSPNEASQQTSAIVFERELAPGIYVLRITSRGSHAETRVVVE